PHRRRVVQVRSRRRGAAAGAIAGCCGLCRRRARGAAAAIEDRERRRQIARPDEVIPIALCRSEPDDAQEFMLITPRIFFASPPPWAARTGMLFTADPTIL